MIDPTTAADVPLRVTLPHGETDPRKTYSLPNPEALRPARDRVRHACYPQPAFSAPDQITVDRSDLVRLLMLADGYLVLAAGPGGQELMVGKLRDLWRARRALEGGEG